MVLYTKYIKYTTTYQVNCILQICWMYNKLSFECIHVCIESGIQMEYKQNSFHGNKLIQCSWEVLKNVLEIKNYFFSFVNSLWSHNENQIIE